MLNSEILKKNGWSILPGIHMCNIWADILTYPDNVLAWKASLHTHTCHNYSHLSGNHAHKTWHTSLKNTWTEKVNHNFFITHFIICIVFLIFGCDPRFYMFFLANKQFQRIWPVIIEGRSIFHPPYHQGSYMTEHNIERKTYKISIMTIKHNKPRNFLTTYSKNYAYILLFVPEIKANQAYPECHTSICVTFRKNVEF